MRNRLLSLLFPLLAACTAEVGGNATTDAGDRGSLGKADLVGSCEHKNKDLCGGKGVGNCWCDDACVEYGDCCDDADTVCGIEPGPAEGEPCGGIVGLQCDDGEFCSYPIENNCGAADQMGECVATPEVCIQLFDPVCGCDGQTYSNSCHAAAAGTSVASEGECAKAGKFCGGFAGFPCGEGEECVDDPSDDCDPANGGADCGGICVPAPTCQPVLCELFCENGFATDENGCEICSCNEPVDTCGPIVKDYTDELAEIMACQSDEQCGQVLAGTSCGCTRNLVARTDADLADLEEIRNKAAANDCSLGGISTCDCPPADGFACEAGMCTWNYL